MPAWASDKFLGQEFRFATDRTLTAFVLGGSHLSRKVLPCTKTLLSPHPSIRRVTGGLSTRSRRAHGLMCPTTFKAMLRQQIRWKKSFIRNIFVTGRFYWRRPFLPALFYYVHVAFVLFGPFVAARHLIYMPLARRSGLPIPLSGWHSDYRVQLRARLPPREPGITAVALPAADEPAVNPRILLAPLLLCRYDQEDDMASRVTQAG